ncbi:hypothetical protein A0H81_10556 [Grifola frondosa]|uniref:Uncharacterized protein n=1 Tax=Grifola frondosa TaxID=5627 RepID=A0A1C7M366_GRIFR|nr:hypothetical protein A0H81_10556 [Grifola frondosa]
MAASRLATLSRIIFGSFYHRGYTPTSTYLTHSYPLTHYTTLPSPPRSSAVPASSQASSFQTRPCALSCSFRDHHRIRIFQPATHASHISLSTSPPPSRPATNAPWNRHPEKNRIGVPSGTSTACASCSTASSAAHTCATSCTLRPTSATAGRSSSSSERAATRTHRGTRAPRPASSAPARAPCSRRSLRAHVHAAYRPAQSEHRGEPLPLQRPHGRLVRAHCAQENSMRSSLPELWRERAWMVEVLRERGEDVWERRNEHLLLCEARAAAHALDDDRRTPGAGRRDERRCGRAHAVGSIAVHGPIQLLKCPAQRREWVFLILVLHHVHQLVLIPPSSSSPASPPSSSVPTCARSPTPACSTA